MDVMDVEFPSPITLNHIKIGKIVKTKKGLFLPKIRWGSYRNIKNGVSQLTYGQAENLIIEEYFRITAEKKGWTQEEKEQTLAEAHEVHRKSKIEDLAKSLAREAEKQRYQERADHPNVRVVYQGEWTKVREVQYTKKTMYKVALRNAKGWKKRLDFVRRLGVRAEPNQKKWKFTSLEDALSLSSLLENAVDEDSNGNPIESKSKNNGKTRSD